MKKYDSLEAMRKALEQRRLCWQCEYCGKVYPSYQKLTSTACHSHPSGAWAGKCHVPNAVKILGETFSGICRNGQTAAQNAAPQPRPSSVQKCGKDIPMAMISKKIITEWGNGNITEIIQAIQGNCDRAIETGIWNDLSGSCVAFRQNILDLKNAVADKRFWTEIFWLTQANLSDENGIPLQPFCDRPGRVLNTTIDAVALGMKNGMDTPFVKDLQISFSALQMKAKYGKGIHESWIPILNRMEKEIIPSPDFWYKLYCLLRTRLSW